LSVSRTGETRPRSVPLNRTGRFRRLIRIGLWLRTLEEVKPSCFMVGNEKARGDFLSPFS
jgi:hypothetical protein